MSINIIEACHKFNVRKLLFLGSSCIYPKLAPQPIKEEYLLTGPLEETNISYAISKIAGVEMCRAYNRQFGTNFICAMPTNVYGENDNFDPYSSHVLPGMIAKFHKAKMMGEKT
jgi:Nucleoside-diphosphate-sugar epimerases